MRSLRHFSTFFLMLVFPAAIPFVNAQRLLTTITIPGTEGYGNLNRTSNRLYVISNTSMLVIDGSSNTIIDSVQLGSAPFAIAFNEKTNKIYIEDGADETVTVVDGATDHVDTVISLGAVPNNLEVNPATNKVYVSEGRASMVAVIDGSSNQITATIPVGTRPSQVRVDPTRNRIYTCNVQGNSVSVIDGSSDTVIANVTVGTAPALILLNTVTNQIYVNNYGDFQGNNNSFSAIDGATLTVRTLNLTGLGSMDVDQVSNKVSVTTSNGTVTVVDGTTLATAVLNVGGTLADVESDAVTNKLYVMNSGDNNVYIYDFADNSLVATVGVGVGPGGAEVNPVTNRVYVFNSDNTISVITDANSAPVQFVPVTPCRLLDTRPPGGNGPIQGGTSQSFNLSQLGGCGIPATAAAYSLNITVVPPGRLGFLTIWPTGESQPSVSTMNSLDGRIKANAAIVPGGYQGEVSVYVNNTTDVLLDINGYFTTAGSSTLQFYPLTPCRVVDTRNANGPLAGPFLNQNQERDFPVLESSCIPSGVTPKAYSFNVTAVPNPGGQRLGFLTVWPQGESRPTVSTLNNLTGTIVANGAIVPAGTGGGVAVYPNNTTDLLIDINGYFADPGTGGMSLYTAAPCRVLDTRTVNGGAPFMNELTVNVIGSQCSPSTSGQAYVFNATVVPPGGLGFLTLWPDGQERPTASTLNAKDGAITSNMAIVPSSNGSIDAFANDLTQLILDISSYFAPQPYH